MVATTIKRKRSFLFLFFLFFFFVFFFFVFSFITVSYWGIVSNVCVSKREERREERDQTDIQKSLRRSRRNCFVLLRNYSPIRTWRIDEGHVTHLYMCVFLKEKKNKIKEGTCRREGRAAATTLHSG
jgi:hypothetical protein